MNTTDERISYAGQASLAFGYLVLTLGLAGILALRGFWLGQPHSTWLHLSLFWWIAAVAYAVSEYSKAPAPASKAGLAAIAAIAALTGVGSRLWPSAEYLMAVAPLAASAFIVVLLASAPRDERVLGARLAAGSSAYVLLAAMLAVDLVSRAISAEPSGRSFDLAIALLLSLVVSTWRFRLGYGWSADDVGRLWPLLVQAALAVGAIGLFIERKPLGSVLFGLGGNVVAAWAVCSWIRRRLPPDEGSSEGIRPSGATVRSEEG
jgi:hypothetical protein